MVRFGGDCASDDSILLLGANFAEFYELFEESIS